VTSNFRLEVCVEMGSYGYRGHTQENGAVSKVGKKCISQPTPAQRTLSAAGTVQVSHALQAVRFYAYCGAVRPVSKMASQQEKALCVVSRPVVTVQREFHAWHKHEMFLCDGSFFNPCTKLTLHYTVG
jgi:hypothetical protein